MIPKRLLFLYSILFICSSLFAQISESGRSGDRTNISQGQLPPQIILKEALPEIDQALMKRSVPQSAVKYHPSDIDNIKKGEKTSSTPLWQMLENLTSAEKENAAINIEPGKELSESARSEVREIEFLWNSGSYTEAIERLRSFQANITDRFAIGISWRLPRSVHQLGDNKGADTRVGLREDVDNVILDYHESTENLFAVLKYYNSSSTSYCFSVNISTNNGSTWTETYSWWASYEINDVSASVIANYLYVGYVGLGATLPTDARVRRFNTSDGSVDGGYGYVSVFDEGSEIVDIALCSNVDYFNNRIYYLAILADNSLIYYWASETGTSWYDASPGIGLALKGLDAHCNEGFVDYYLMVSFIGTDNNSYVGLRSSDLGWQFYYFGDPAYSGAYVTSIAAYSDIIITVYKDENADIRYWISYNAGSNWYYGIIASGGFFWQPHVAGRMDGGFRVNYQEEVGEPDLVFTTRRDYGTANWETPYSINETDVVTGTKLNTEWIPPLSGAYAHGAIWIGKNDYWEAWFDRIEDIGEPDIDVTPTSLVINEPTDLNVTGFHDRNYNEQPKNLFEEVSRRDVSLTDEQRDLLVGFDMLETTVELKLAKANTRLLKGAGAVYLNLFSNENYTAVKYKIEERANNDFTWYGNIEGLSDGSAIIVCRDNQLTGTIRARGLVFAIRTLGNGMHVILRQDLTNLPPEHPPEFEAIMKQPSTFTPYIPGKFDNYDDGSVYDVLVAYTPSAASAAGDIASLINLAIAETNTSYNNSGIWPRVNLVHTYQVSYSESGNFDTDLTRFRTPGDGYMDEVHTLRNTYAADVCVIIINNTAYCGLASAIMANETTAFCAVHWDCATGYYSFGHEIGHLQGARHNPEADPTTTPFPYGHGYLYATGGWRTVMSYNHSSCPGGYCTRLQYWSNPDVLYGGIPMGTAATHDNARVLDETAFTVANWRVSSVAANTFTIYNIGTAVLNIQSITDNKTWLTHSGYPSTPFEILPGSSQTVTVSVDWSLLSASDAGTIVIASNDPDEPTVEVSVTANPAAPATPPPENLFAFTGYHKAVPIAWEPPAGYAPLEDDQVKLSKVNDDDGTKYFRSDGEVEESFKYSLKSSPTLLYYKLYRSTTPGGPYSLVASNIQKQYWRDQSLTNGTTYYYIVKAYYDTGEGDPSNEANAKPSSSGYTINSSFAATPPTLNGVINTSEWSGATLINITYPGLSPTVNLFVMNDGNNLYLAVDDPSNVTLQDYDQIGIYFDENYNREWPAASPSGEGNFWVEWLTGSSLTKYRGIYGWWPNNLGFDSPISATGVSQAISTSSGHVQYEVSINLSTSQLNAAPGNTIGFWMFSQEVSSYTFSGYWPQVTALAPFDVWALPAVYGDLKLAVPAAPPEINVTPGSFTFNLAPGGTDNDVMTISNIAPAGSMNLIWDIIEQEVTSDNYVKSGVSSDLASPHSNIAADMENADSPKLSDCTWITESPIMGSLSPGQSSNININVDAAGLSSGTYNCNIVINNNDPDENPTIIPVTLNVGCPGSVVGSVICPGSGPQGGEINLPINVDMSGMPSPDDKLGSFTGTLSYNPSLLDYTGNSGILAGFTGVINVNETTGLISFNGANPSGASGSNDILNIDFDIIGAVGNTCNLDLEFQAMAAALTFTDLLPCLTVNDCSFEIIPPGFLGDINADDLCNSTDALIILSYDVGLTIPAAFLDRITHCYGDVNSDGLTNSTDALIILSADVGISVPFPVCEPFVPCSKNLAVGEGASVDGNIKLSALPKHGAILKGNIIEIPVMVDMSGMKEKLGSYTAELTWDPEIFEYKAYMGGTTPGFENPVVNLSESDKGKISFAQAYPAGAGKLVNLINLNFVVIGETGESSPLKLSFSSLASAKSFINLLPNLENETETVFDLKVGDKPSAYGLENYPNPFNPTTIIRYTLPETQSVKIVIYDILGQQVIQLVNEEQKEGVYQIEWNSENESGGLLPSGVYILRMHAGNFIADRKLLLLK